MREMTLLGALVTKEDQRHTLGVKDGEAVLAVRFMDAVDRHKRILFPGTPVHYADWRLEAAHLQFHQRDGQRACIISLTVCDDRRGTVESLVRHVSQGQPEWMILPARLVNQSQYSS